MTSRMANADRYNRVGYTETFDEQTVETDHDVLADQTVVVYEIDPATGEASGLWRGLQVESLDVENDHWVVV